MVSEGKWVIDPCYDVIAVDDVDVDCNGMVAMVTPHPKMDPRARLIAAAPELLAALIGATEHMHWSRPEGEAAFKAAKAAIAKATGAA